MKVLLVGHKWWGAITEYTEEALKQLGCSVKKFYYWPDSAMASFWQKALFSILDNNRIKRYFSKQGLMFHQYLNEKMNEHLINKANFFKPDIILIIKGESIYPETIKKIRKDNTCTISSWLIDRPVPYKSPPYVKETLSLLDYIFTFDSYYIDQLKNLGVQHVYHLPLACSPSIHKKVKLSSEELDYYGSDVAFSGSVQPLRQKMLEYINGFDTKVWGPGFKNVKKENMRIVGGVITNKEVVKIYNASKISLNVNHPQSIYGTNTRTYEALGSGAFILNDFKKEISELFEIGKEIICYKRIEELNDLISYYLKNPNIRQEIAAKGQKRVYDEHTYYHRIKKLLSVIDRNREAEPATRRIFSIQKVHDEIRNLIKN